MEKELKELIINLKNKYREWQEVEDAYGFYNDETGIAFNNYEDAEAELIDYLLNKWKED